VADQEVAKEAAPPHAAALSAVARPSPDAAPKAHSVSPRPLNLPIKVAPPLIWRSWPLVDEGTQHWPVLGATLAVAAISGLALGSYMLFGCVLALQWLALWRLWLPVEYELDERGIRQTVLGRSVRVPWSAIRSCQILPEGIFLSPDAEPNAFANWRGRFIPWGQQRAEILAAVNKLAARLNHASTPESTMARNIGPESDGY
jgi:hypothetical protein